MKKELKWLVLHIEEIIACVALGIMLCVIFLNVIMRYVFRDPLNWSDELSMICLAYVTFVGGAAAYKKKISPSHSELGIFFVIRYLLLVIHS